jgi:hypothetical protein
MMGRLGDELEADRAVRNAARRAFESRLAQVQEDLETRGIGRRIADRLGEEARGTFEEAMDVASESKGIIAGTIAALALWIFRNPIIAWLEGMLGHDEGTDDEGDTSCE